MALFGIVALSAFLARAAWHSKFIFDAEQAPVGARARINRLALVQVAALLWGGVVFVRLFDLQTLDRDH